MARACTICEVPFTNNHRSRAWEGHGTAAGADRNEEKLRRGRGREDACRGRQGTELWGIGGVGGCFWG